MNALTRDRQVGVKLSPTETAILTLAILLLIASLVGLIVWADCQIQRYERRAVDAEAELADARKERTMLMDALKGLGEGTESMQ